MAWAGMEGPVPDNWIPITFKIRHTPEYHPGYLELLAVAAGESGRGVANVDAVEKIHGVAPGQFCVIYDAQHHKCYGSGEITL